MLPSWQGWGDGSRGIALPFLEPRRQLRVVDERHVPAALRQGMRPDFHCPGSWVGLEAGLHYVKKISCPPGFERRTVQWVASHYTAYVTLATFRELYSIKY